MAILNSTLRLTLLDQVSVRAKVINSSLNSIRATQSALLGTFGRIAAFGGAYLGVTAGLGATAGAAIEFESAFADVKKVLNGSDEQLENVRRQIIGMSRELPIAAGGIAEIYAAAAQANIPMNEISKFSEMVAKVSTAWEVPVKETGQALAEIKNQLNLGVTEVGLFADSLNHLSNNTAANAPRLLEYTKRVAATGEMFGFTAQETLAFGGAMISAGGESEVAATSFRNMGRALTIGTRATKSHNTAFKRLGLDAVKTAKGMQKNALKTTLDVIGKIQELPEWERISIASALFGDEARALMPVINNSTELRRQLGLVGDQANYAGSAFEEYIKRADTVGNVLQILRNKFADTFRADTLLGPIKEAALGVGDILDTLGERGHIFAQMEAAMQGFRNGLGLTGGIREAINELGDLLLGKADGSDAADRMGRIFVKFKEWGASVREFSAAIAENPIAQLFKDLAPYGFQIMLWGVGIAFLAGTIRKLAAALMFLSGASAIIGALKVVGGLAGIVGGGTVAAGGAAGAAAAGASGVAAGASGWLMRTLGTLGAGLGALGVSQTLGLGSRGTAEQEYDMARRLRAQVESGKANNATNATIGQSTTAGVIAQMAIDAARYARAMGTGGSTTDTLPGKTADDVGVTRIDSSSIQQMIQPSGVQQVQEVNRQPPPNVTVHNSFIINEAANPTAVANEVGAQTGQAVKTAVDSAFIDAQ